MSSVERHEITAQSKRRLLSVNDPVLAPLIETADEMARQKEIEHLISEHALPVARSAIETFSRDEWALDAHDIGDIIGMISLRLVRKLQLVPRFEEQAVAQFDDYVHMLARHSAYDFIRSRFPQRARLRNRLRYLLRNHEEFEVWSTQRGTVCGLRSWHRRGTAATSAELAELDLPSIAIGEDSDAAVIVRSVLRRVGRPVRLEALLTVISDRRDEREPPPAAIEIPDLGVGDEVRLESRESLSILWREIERLRPLQRTALLLNMREAAGLDAVTLFAVLGIATMEQIAEAAGMAADDLARIVDDLPLEDNIIAARLGVTRQQVINLRKSARARLARRLLKQTSRRPT